MSESGLPEHFDGEGGIQLIPEGEGAITMTTSINIADDDVGFTVPKREFTYNEYVEAMGFNFIHVVIMVVSGITWAFDAQITVLLSLLIPVIVEKMGFSWLMELTFLAVCYVGSFMGALVFGYISDIFGRRYGFIFMSFLIFTFGMIAAFSENLYLMLICVFFVGLGVGSCAIPFTYFTELIPTQGRGIVLLFFQLFWSFGSVVEAFLGFVFLDEYGWRVFLGVTVAPVFIILLISIAIPESPRFYYMKGRYKDAEKTLKRFRIGSIRRKHVPKEFRLVPDQVADDQEPTVEEAPIDEESQVSDVGDVGGSESVSTGKNMNFLTLFSRKYLLTTLLLAPIWISVTFIYYGIIFLTPLYFSGTNDSSAKYLFTMITTLAEVPGLIVAIFLIELIGRKRTITIYFLVCGIATAVLLFTFVGIIPDFVFVVATFLARASIIGAFDVLYIYTPEVYPTQVRATAVGLFTSLSRLSGAVSPVLPYIFVGKNILVPILLYSVFSFIASIFSIFLPFETAHKFLDAII